MSSSLEPACNDVKEKYDSCFLKWYTEKYIGQKATSDECAPLFKQYQACLTKALKERGIEEMLAEARETNAENDAKYLKKTGCMFE